MDIDGTLSNQAAIIPGVSESIFRLLTDDSKKVLFYSNGGYCNLETTWQKIIKWLRTDLPAEKFAIVEPILTKNLVYNTAQLTGKWLQRSLEPNAKILTFGNDQFNEELNLAGLNAQILKPLLPGETQYSPCLTDSQFATYVADPEVKAIAKGVTQTFDQRKLAIASLYLQNPDVLFVTTNDDPIFIAGPNGRKYPDVGATLSALEKACGREAYRVGKPQDFGLKAILADHFSED